MKGINWLDVLILLPLLVGLVRGIMRGFISEIIAFVVVIFGVLGARMVAPSFSAWLLRSFAWPQEVCNVVAYVLVFLAIAILLSLLARMLTRLLRVIHLGWINRTLGGVFGLLKFAVLILIVVFAMEHTNRTFHWLDKAEIVKTSILYPYAVEAVDQLEKAVK